MATLFLGRRDGAAGFSKPIAIKVIHPHLVKEPGFVEMFLDEARLASNIQHPNVVAVEELGELDGQYYLVMEYVHGCSLAQLGRQLGPSRRLSLDLVLHIVSKVAEALHAAHEARDESGKPLQVVHRDVSPQNILLAYQGHVKLIDFGIAKAKGRSRQTTARSLKGKLAYMAPEQAWGKEVDRRTDVYALGVVAWELLTTQKLFDSDDDFALLEEVRQPAIAKPSSLVDGIPSDVEAVVMRALRAAPEDRFASAREFRNELLTAFPAAATVDAAEFGSFLQTLMADEIRREHAVLPETVSDAFRDVSSPADPATLATFTVASSSTEADALSPAPRRRINRPLWVAVSLLAVAALSAGAYAAQDLTFEDSVTAPVEHSDPPALVESSPAAESLETTPSTDPEPPETPADGEATPQTAPMETQSPRRQGQRPRRNERTPRVQMVGMANVILESPFDTMMSP